VFVEIPQHTVSQKDHGNSEHDEARSRAEQWPVLGDPRFEDGQLGEDKKS
jgi:hypothetical protein